MNTFRQTSCLPKVELPQRPSQISHPKVRPPETNPIDGKGYSYTRAAMRRANPESHIYGISSAGPMTTYRDVLGLGDGERERNEEYVDQWSPFLVSFN